MIEKIIKADGQEIKWDHSSGNEHRFKVLNIQHEEEAYKMKLVAKGTPLDVDRINEEEIEIPSIKEFRVLSASVNLSGDLVCLHFLFRPNPKEPRYFRVV